MSRLSFCATKVSLAVLLCTWSLSAQSVDIRPVRFGIMAGATVPVDLLSDATGTGFNIGALVSIRIPRVPLSVRIDGQWHQLGGSGPTANCSFTPGGGDYCPEPIDFRVIDGTADLVYTFRDALPTNFYVIAGGGVYRERAVAPADNNSRGSATKFGVNGGVGLNVKLGTIGGFLEARYHNILHGSDVGDYARRSEQVKSLQFVAISAGIVL
ncbi:MAG: porin family protein [Gemmatimonadota bacterium]|nr:porin family protein [Gemmatimonadota bacterium]